MVLVVALVEFLEKSIRDRVAKCAPKRRKTSTKKPEYEDYNNNNNKYITNRRRLTGK